MVVSTWSQGRKLQNHIAIVRRFDTNVMSPEFGRYSLDVMREYGSSRNYHGLDSTKDLIAIEKWLTEHEFKQIN